MEWGVQPGLVFWTPGVGRPGVGRGARQGPCFISTRDRGHRGSGPGPWGKSGLCLSRQREPQPGPVLPARTRLHSRPPARGRGCSVGAGAPTLGHSLTLRQKRLSAAPLGWVPGGSGVPRGHGVWLESSEHAFPVCASVVAGAAQSHVSLPGAQPHGCDLLTAKPTAAKLQPSASTVSALASLGGFRSTPSLEDCCGPRQGGGWTILSWASEHTPVLSSERWTRVPWPLDVPARCPGSLR